METLEMRYSACICVLVIYILFAKYLMSFQKNRFEIIDSYQVSQSELTYCAATASKNRNGDGDYQSKSQKLSETPVTNQFQLLIRITHTTTHQQK